MPKWMIKRVAKGRLFLPVGISFALIAMAYLVQGVPINTHEGQFGSSQADASPQRLTLYPVDDAYIRDGIYSTNNYNTSELVVKGEADPDWSRETLLKFHLGSGPSSVQSAILTLHVESTSGANTITVYSLNDHDWVESEVTWLTAPTQGAEVITETVKEAGALRFDITSLVNQALGNGDTCLGLNLASAGDGTLTTFSSDESTHRPKLELIRYVESRQ